MPAPPAPAEYWFSIQCPWGKMEEELNHYGVPMRTGKVIQVGAVNVAVMQSDLPPLYSGKKRLAIAMWWQKFESRATGIALEYLTEYKRPSGKHAALLSNDWSLSTMCEEVSREQYSVLLFRQVVGGLGLLCKAGSGASFRTIQTMRNSIPDASIKDLMAHVNGHLQLPV